MKPYKNISGNSGILAYEAGATFIKIKFVGGDIYLYDHKKPGKLHVEEMKRRAGSGRGLATYISQMVRDNYASHL